ncbi:MAG: CDP-glycerol glycerophosphotransferase family protein [Hominenteromicrobium sp.]
MFEIADWKLEKLVFSIRIKGVQASNAVQPPRLSVRFRINEEDRILPLPAQAGSGGSFMASYAYELWNLFRNGKKLRDFSITFLDHMQPISVKLPEKALDGWTVETLGTEIALHAGKTLRLHPVYRNLRGFFRANGKERKKLLCTGLMHMAYLPYRLLRVHPNRVSFCSNRREALSGNLAFVYEKLAEGGALDLQVQLGCAGFSFESLFRFFYLYATSRVLVVDDYYLYLSYVPRRKETKVVQLWHACGAFKTFGFSRLGKDTSLLQSSGNHRQYDAAIVSSRDIMFCYAEGFGIPSRCVYPLGVPRTDVFFDRAYRSRVRSRFFAEYPSFAGKRIVLFAPTFRGGGKGNAFYPLDRFPINRLLAELGEDTAFLIKMHPYVSERFSVDPVYADRVLDCSEDAELNDLLFVTDVLITDYSSVVYEAALLNIPMLFYAFDLEAYIAARDFYCDFVSWIPGKLVRTPQALTDALQKRDFEAEKLRTFCAVNMNGADGRAAMRAAELIRSMI